jgi:hypothetical protein
MAPAGIGHIAVSVLGGYAGWKALVGVRKPPARPKIAAAGLVDEYVL